MMSNPVHSCDSSQLSSVAQDSSTITSSLDRPNDQAIIDGLQTEIAALKEQHKLAMEEKHTKSIRAQDDMIAKSKSLDSTTAFFSLCCYQKTFFLLNPNLPNIPITIL